MQSIQDYTAAGNRLQTWNFLKKGILLKSPYLKNIKKTATGPRAVYLLCRSLHLPGGYLNHRQYVCTPTDWLLQYHMTIHRNRDAGSKAVRYPVIRDTYRPRILTSVHTEKDYTHPHHPTS